MIPLLLARELARALAAVWRDPETKALPVVAGALVLTGTIFYWRFEDGPSSKPSTSVSTLTSVGYGGLLPTSAGTQIFTIVYILTGIRRARRTADLGRAAIPGQKAGAG